MTTLFKRTLLALALTGLALSGTVSAAEPSFESLDANNDGALTPNETASVEGFDFEKADENGDGVLSPEEYKKVARA